MVSRNNLTSRDIACVQTSIPHKRYTISSSSQQPIGFFIFYSVLFRPPKEVGDNGDLYILQTSSKLIIYWKKKMSYGRCIWLEVGGNGLNIQHPIHKRLILRGGTCHLYPHWCIEDGSSNNDDLYNAARCFLGEFGLGSSLEKPVDLTFG